MRIEEEGRGREGGGRREGEEGMEGGGGRREGEMGEERSGRGVL